MLNSLVAMKCDLIATGTSKLHKAVLDVARKHPTIRFVLPGSTGGLRNVTTLPKDRAAITHVVVAAANSYYRTVTTVPPPTR
jgi:hypothetical protein